MTIRDIDVPTSRVGVCFVRVVYYQFNASSLFHNSFISSHHPPPIPATGTGGCSKGAMRTRICTYLGRHLFHVSIPVLHYEGTPRGAGSTTPRPSSRAAL